MEKEFISFKQALALKELGFNEPCFVYYCEDIGYQIQYKNPMSSEDFNSRKGVYLNDISAPLKQQAFRWFREKYLLFGYPFPNDYQNYGYRIVKMTSDENKELVYDWGTKDTYEEAELACLDKLIKIVKNV